MNELNKNSTKVDREFDDLIKRQDAIDAMENLCKECDADYCGECRIDYPDKDAKSVLEALPSAQQWIPVSERLPEAMEGSMGECSDDVLICVKDYEDITISTGFLGYYEESPRMTGWWSVWAYGCRKIDEKYEVVAWMPLPEPYKEVEE